MLCGLTTVVHVSENLWEGVDSLPNMWVLGGTIGTGSRHLCPLSHLISLELNSLPRDS